MTSLVNDILMPIVGILIGGLDFTGLKIEVGTATITYGNFIQNVVDFLIVAACIFAMLKFLAHLKRQQMINLIRKNLKKDDTVVLLEEIRDLLKKIDKVN